jgi:hypothetical protein
MKDRSSEQELREADKKAKEVEDRIKKELAEKEIKRKEIEQKKAEFEANKKE